MTAHKPSVSSLVDALNDRSRTRIGDPWRGTFQISIAVDHAHEASELAKQLDRLGVTYQANFKRDKRGTPTRAFLTIYGLDDQQRILETLAYELEPSRRRSLETLVAARSPISPDVVRKLRVSLSLGKSYEYLAGRLNELGIVSGMGSRHWTPKKLKRKLAEATAEAEQVDRSGQRAA
jgi:hypothetical protein